MPRPAIRPPERLSAEHDLSAFENGMHPVLDQWLQERALASEGLSARTYVICSEQQPNRVIGYYAISTAMEERSALPTAKLRRGLPDRVPLLLIGRLAVSQEFQGRGLGADLLSDAIHRCLAASEIAGARAIIAHAIDNHAAAFYRAHGFLPSPLAPHLMMLPIDSVRAASRL
jgi:GNAT superfamily N-acetyltransferase